MTVQLDISDQLVQKYGIQHLLQRIEQQIRYDELQLQAQTINVAVQEAGLDHDALFEEAREKAWASYKPQLTVHFPQWNS